MDYNNNNKSMYEYIMDYIPKNYEECRNLYLFAKKYYQIVILVLGFLLATFSRKIFGKKGPKYFKNIVVMVVILGLIWRYSTYAEEKRKLRESIYYEPNFN